MVEEYQPKSILITGGGCFIGSHVLRHLVLSYPFTHIVCLDIFESFINSGFVEDLILQSNFSFIKGSVLNLELINEIMLLHKIDTVMHFASKSQDDGFSSSCLEFTQTNVVGTHILLECAKQFNIRRFIYVSSDEVYGQVKNEMANESNDLSPQSAFACSKVVAEFICQAYIRSFKMPIIITRGNDAFGPWQFRESLIPNLILLLNENQKISLHGDGSDIRNIIHINDVVKAFDLILRKGIDHQIYNIGITVGVSMKELAVKLVSIFHKSGNPEDWIEYFPAETFQYRRYLINSNKLNQLGWFPNIDFDHLLKETVDWYLSHLKF